MDLHLWQSALRVTDEELKKKKKSIMLPQTEIWYFWGGDIIFFANSRN